MVNRSVKKENHTTEFLLGSFVFLLIISIGAFVCLGVYMRNVSEASITEVGNLYMEGINDHITAHFRTLIDLKLEQLESVAEVISPDIDDMEKLHEELVYRCSVRNFNYVALCSEDRTLEMLYGEQISITDPEPFFNSLSGAEKKVAVGRNDSGKEVVVFGMNAAYQMKNGEKSMALVTAVPIDYISAMLGTDEEDALIITHIIREDGSFIISELSAEYPDYFTSVYKRYKDNEPEKLDGYIKNLSEAMKNKEDYSIVMHFNEKSQQIYSTSLPYSEWHLVTVLPFGVLNETLEGMNHNRTAATIIICVILFLVLICMFYWYYTMTNQQLRELEEARQAALAATIAKSTFLSNMSHDIRTPMNAIVGMTAIANAHIDDKEQVQNCLRKITLSGKHLLGLINDVLDMSKIESGKMTLTAELISLREVVEGVVAIIQTQVKGKEQSFNVHIDNIVAEEVYCDSVRLNQVLMNLLSNAVKYTQEGGSIRLHLYQEKAPAEKGDDYIRTHITVQDNGIGMSEEFVGHVFDSYSRADSERVHKIEGAGLGMAITKHIVDAMGGTITVESKPGEGSKFQVIVDMEKADTAEFDMVLPAWKMLVVDDDEMLCRTATDALDSIGIQADWTLSGEEAIEMVKEHHQRRDDYQIVMLDWKLPGMDGLMLSREIRKIADEDMPIILISAYDWSEFEEDAREAGINGFIAKPLFKSTLFYGLKKYMDGEEIQDAAEQEQDSDLTGRCVLVAEDNEINWEILEELLSESGLKLDWAENGKLCLEKFEASKEGTYDAILMDVRMPVMNGYEATEAIRKSGHPDAQKIPIIAMTADAFSEDVNRCLESGMNAHTAKPINLTEMLSLLKKYIS